MWKAVNHSEVGAQSADEVRMNKGRNEGRVVWVELQLPLHPAVVSAALNDAS